MDRPGLKDVLLTAEEVPEGCDYVVDGTLFSCWSQRRRQSPRIVVAVSTGRPA